MSDAPAQCGLCWPRSTRRMRCEAGEEAELGRGSCVVLCFNFECARSYTLTKTGTWQHNTTQHGPADPGGSGPPPPQAKEAPSRPIFLILVCSVLDCILLV